jgi:DNA polymerase-1
MAEKRLVIIDGFSLLFRAFYGTRYMSTSDGRPTNALYGLVSMLFTLIEREKPASIVVALDSPGKTFRDAEYPEYKGTRRETPAELISQIELSQDLIRSLGIPTIAVVGYEADDIVGTIALDAERNGYETTIVTGDTDQFQLVDDHVKVMTTRQGVTDVVYYDVAAVHERYGFGPELIPDYKALVGDTSDNIPGVPGVGDKTATKLLQEFGAVETIIGRITEVEEKFRKKLEPHLAQIPKSKWLATIVRDVPLQFDYEPFRVSREEYEAAKTMLESLEFRTHMKKLPTVLEPYMEAGQPGLFGDGGAVAEAHTEVTVRDAATREEVLSWMNGRVAGLYVEGSEAAVAIGADALSISIEVANSLIEGEVESLALHHAKQFQKRTKTYRAAAFDTMLACYVLQSGRSNYLLEDIAQGYLDEPPPRTVPEKAAAVHRLIEPMSDRLKLENQWSVYDEVENPLTPILAEMENTGILVDRPRLEEFSAQLAASIAQVEEQVYAHAGEKFTIGSPQQLGKILFDKLGAPSGKMNKTGYATGAEVLQELAPNWPIAQEVLNWRELTKLKSTYADALPKLIAEDGRIHTTYAQTVAATGRLSSVDPNLQNIPVRTELGKEIRRAFVPEAGFSLLSVDYSQIELRLLAHECKDETLLQAFESGQDVHSATAATMWKDRADGVTAAHRRYAKMLNYAVLYGVTDYGLASQLGGEFSVADAKVLIETYFSRFPKVRDYVKQTLETARSKGFTTTIAGRRRYFPDIHAGNRVTRQYAERQALNAPLQGGSADLIKIAMNKIRPMLDGMRTRMLLQVHDELLFELAESEHDLIPEIKSVMENAMPLDVPIVADVGIGPNWLEVKG